MLDLRFEQPAPSLLVLRWEGEGTLDEAGVELLEKVQASFRPGTHLIVIPAPGEFPDRVQALIGCHARSAPMPAGDDESPFADARASTSDSGPPDELGLIVDSPMAVAFVRGRHEGQPVANLVLGPPGRHGTTWILPPGADPTAAIERLLDPSRRQELERVVEQHRRHLLGDLPRELEVDRAEHPRLANDRLDVGVEESEREFSHQIHGGGERTATRALDGDRLVWDVGRLVRGREEFTVPLGDVRWFEPRTHLVVVRRTDPADAGQVLRVQQDEFEDLGPWHLAHGAIDGRWFLDTLRIAPELLDGKDSTTLSLLCEPGAGVGSFRYSFLLEPEPDGLWLTELEPDQIEGPPPGFDRDVNGAPLIHDGHLFLRGLGCRDGRITYELPDGYGSFETTPQGAPGVEFAVVVNGDRVDATPGEPLRRPLPGACTLVLECRADDPAAFSCWGAPVLLRS